MEKSMPIAIVATVISVVAVISAATAIVLRPMPTIGAGDVGTNELADGSVTGAKIADGTITDADVASAGISRIANDSVGSDQISGGSITLSDLSSAVVDAITGAENIADNSITSEKIADGTITNVDISSTAAIDLSKLATYPFGLADLAADSVDGTKIVDGNVASADIQDGAVQTTDIAAGAVTQWAENGASTAVQTTTIGWTDLPDTTITITTGSNPVLIIFSGRFSNDTASQSVMLHLVVDGVGDSRTRQEGVSSAGFDAFSLSFNSIKTLTAGGHTIKVEWQPSAGTAVSHNRIIDVIELKR